MFRVLPLAKEAIDMWLNRSLQQGRRQCEGWYDLVNWIPMVEYRRHNCEEDIETVSQNLSFPLGQWES